MTNGMFTLDALVAATSASSVVAAVSDEILHSMNLSRGKTDYDDGIG